MNKNCQRQNTQFVESKHAVLRIEKMFKKKVNKLYVKQDGYDNLDS